MVKYTFNTSPWYMQMTQLRIADVPATTYFEVESRTTTDNKLTADYFIGIILPIVSFEYSWIKLQLSSSSLLTKAIWNLGYHCAFILFDVKI